MKNTIFLAFAILFGFGAFGQELIINRSVSLNISEKLTQLSKDQETSLRKDKFKGFAFGNLIEKKSYSADNMLLRIYGSTTNEKNIIALNKENLDKMCVSLMPLHYFSSIEIIKNNTILITQLKGYHKDTYSFLAQDSTKTKLLSGTIYYHDGEEKKAKTLLYKLLNGITFKE
jgi:hypothetical protein